jgi:dTDP-glucose pyrophosphorylase
VVPVIEPILPAGASLRDAIAVIEHTRRLIAVVVDADRCLLGVLSDGDIRRAILRGLELDRPAADAMTRQPIVGQAAAGDDAICELMMTRGVAAIPLVDQAGRFVRVVQLQDFATERQWTGGEGYYAAVIMAGGEGKRLLPLTLDRPKPMIDVGGVPLLERQVRSMVKSGLKRIYISTNYLGHLIEAHFGDGSQFGVEIHYLRESIPLGTAGALSLLPRRPEGPILVINGDVLTTSDFGRLLAYHQESEAFATVGAMQHRVEIPFGVLRINGHQAIAIEEKPSESFMCNAGIYVLTPEAIDLVPLDTRIDMTELITRTIAAGRRVSVFPIHEYWADIGNPSDLDRVLKRFREAKD